MFRTISTLLLILAGIALIGVLVLLLAFRLVFSIFFALSGVRLHALQGERALRW